MKSHQIKFYNETYRHQKERCYDISLPTIGGDELVFENERDCYKARENDVRE